MSSYQPRIEPRHDHAPDTDDVWAWVIIGLVAAGVMLAIWTPMLKVMFQA